jgi:hypothetical protein
MGIEPSQDEVACFRWSGNASIPDYREGSYSVYVQHFAAGCNLMRTFSILYFYADGTMEEQTFWFKRDRDAVSHAKSIQKHRAGSGPKEIVRFIVMEK